MKWIDIPYMSFFLMTILTLAFWWWNVSYENIKSVYGIISDIIMQNRLCIGPINVTHPGNFRKKISLHAKIINETESNYGVPQKLRCPRQLTVCLVIFLILIVLIRMYNQILQYVWLLIFLNQCSYLKLINYYFKYHLAILAFSHTQDTCSYSCQKIAKYTETEVIAY